MKRSIILCLLAAACAPTDDAGARADALLAELEPGWNQVHAEEGTSCAHGTDFSFWFHPGDAERLVVFLDGGGACWFGEICALDRNPTYDPTVDETDDPDRRHEGIFDFDNPDNPVRDRSFLVIPYCTADVHVGAANTTYDVAANDSLPAGEVEIRHRGDLNVRTTLDWLFERIGAPTEVLVTGVSAGALGSAFHAHEIAARFPEARVVQLGDAAGGYRVETGVVAETVLEAWGSAEVLGRLGDVDIATFDFETLYTDALRKAPNLRMSQINYHEDEVQLAFLGLLGIREVPLIELLDANLEEVRSASPTFRSYTIPGSEHGILHSQRFYDTDVDGVKLRDWTADLLSGTDVPTIACAACR